MRRTKSLTTRRNPRVERSDHLPHEGEVELGFQTAVEVLVGDEILQREVIG